MIIILDQYHEKRARFLSQINKKTLTHSINVCWIDRILASCNKMDQQTLSQRQKQESTLFLFFQLVLIVLTTPTFLCVHFLPNSFQILYLLLIRILHPNYISSVTVLTLRKYGNLLVFQRIQLHTVDIGRTMGKLIIFQ